MTQLGFDNFTRGNQAGWGTASDGQTWTKQSTGTASISSDTGTLTSSTVGTNTIETLGNSTPADCELLAIVETSSTTDTVGIIARWATGNNWYRLALTNGGADLRIA